MSRRRRQRNPLLVRIILISVVAHIIALPILAHFGAFEKVRKSFGTATVVMLQPEKAAPKPPPEAKKVKKEQTQNANRGTNKGHSAAARKDLPQVAVASGQGDGSGPAVEQGSAQGGALPPGVDNKSKVGDDKSGNSEPNSKAPITTKPDTTAPTPVVTKTPTPPPPPPPPIKHKPVYTEVEAVYQPQPQIPDDLLDTAMDKTATVEVTVGSDGSISTATLMQSCGVRELDELAVRTARTWHFKPATADGAPVEGKVRIHIEFKVE